MPTKPSIRNPVARSPLLRKGGVHEKSATAKRQGGKQHLQQSLDDWREELEFEREFERELNGHSDNSLIDDNSIDEVFFIAVSQLELGLNVQIYNKRLLAMSG